MTEDVQNVIQEKDQELEKFVANMDQEQMERTLTDFVPSGMDDLSVWKRDRQKRAWKRLSAFGLVRDDPSLYQQWKQQRQVGKSIQQRVKEELRKIQNNAFRWGGTLSGSYRDSDAVLVLGGNVCCLVKYDGVCATILSIALLCALPLELTEIALAGLP